MYTQTGYFRHVLATKNKSEKYLRMGMVRPAIVTRAMVWWNVKNIFSLDASATEFGVSRSDHQGRQRDGVEESNDQITSHRTHKGVIMLFAIRKNDFSLSAECYDIISYIIPVCVSS